MTNKYRCIILHVGLNKTGSTTIQNQCQHQQHDLLLANGIKYATFTCDGIARPNHSGPVTVAMFDRADRYGKDWRNNLKTAPGEAQRAYREQFHHMLTRPQAENLLLSGETFSLYRDEDMLQLRERLLAAGEQLRVLVYMRDPVSFVESIVQQRVRGGRRPDPERLMGLMRYRHNRLKRVFGEALEVLNFNQAVGSSLGLLGHFLHTCGVPEEHLTQLEAAVANPRASLEACRIMRAINDLVPLRIDDQPSPLRGARDMQALNGLPGTRFTLREFSDSQVYQLALAERDWFQEKLGMVFEDKPAPEVDASWPFETLAILESHIRDLDSAVLRDAATRFLDEEADRLAENRLETAAVLRFIARRIRERERQPPSKLLRELGPDYFRAGAQQVSRFSPELELKLLQAALELRPEGREIAQRLEQAAIRSTGFP